MPRKSQDNDLMEQEIVEQVAEPVQVAADDPYRRVSIMLQKDGLNKRGPLFVNVNDYSAMIPRGQVENVPFFVAKHIEECEAQDQQTILYIEQKSEEGSNRLRQIGV